MEVGGHGDVIAPPQCTVESEGPGAVDNGNMSLFDAQLTMITGFSVDTEATALPQSGSWKCASEACRPECAFPQDLSNSGS